MQMELKNKKQKTKQQEEEEEARVTIHSQLIPTIIGENSVKFIISN